MPLVLAIEPDPRQASVVERVVKGQVRAELVLVDSKDAALAALAARIPDVILVTALMPPRDEDELTGYLKTVPHAGHVQTLAIPLLADAEPEPTLTRRLFKPLRRKSGKGVTDGCAPTTFGEQVLTYLQRAAEARGEREPETAPEPVPEAAVEPRVLEAAAQPPIQERVAQPIAEALPESFMEVEEAVVVDLETQPIPESPVELAPEPEAAEPIGQPATEFAATAPDAELSVDAAAQPVPEPAHELVEQESVAAKPVIEPPAVVDEEPVVAEFVSEPLAKVHEEIVAAALGVEAAAEPSPEETCVQQEAEAVAETVSEAAVEGVSEPAPPEEPTRWLWSDVRPLPALMVFQKFLADSREESPARGYQLQRARAVDVHLFAESSVVPEAEQLPEPVEEPAAVPELDTSLWDKLFVALEDRFNQEKAKVASTEAAAAQQARKYIQSRKAARRRTYKTDPVVLTPPAAGRKGTSALDSLRSDIERLLHKNEPLARRREPKRQPPADDSDSEPVGATEVPQPEPPSPPRAIAPEPAVDPMAEDEWGFHDPDRCGFAALMARVDAQEAERQAAAGAQAQGGTPRRDDSSRIAPLSVWAHAATQEPADATSLPLDPLGHPVKADPSLRLPDDVVAVRYATGCRIGEIRVPERTPGPDDNEKPVVLLSKKLLKKPR